MIFRSTVPSFGYNLNSNNDHEFYNSQQISMSPQVYEYILVAASLEINNKRLGFTEIWVIWGLVG